MKSRLPTSWVHDFEHGASLHGNWAACNEALETMQRFSGGQPCPSRCGSIIRYQVGRPRQESVQRHTQSPFACMKHPQHRKARRRVRTEADAPAASAQVPSAALRERAGRPEVRARGAGGARPDGVRVQQS